MGLERDVAVSRVRAACYHNEGQMCGADKWLRSYAGGQKGDSWVKSGEVKENHTVEAETQIHRGVTSFSMP